MDITLFATGITVIATIWGLGWKIANCMNDIRVTVARIETLLQATSQRLDRIEVEVKDIDNRVRQMEKLTNE